jgi:hypothetical protein
MFASLAIVGAISLSAPYAGAREDPPLVRLAAVTFPNLTHAERAMLEFAQAGNVYRGQFAVAGPNASPDDPSNDPKGESEWSKDREIRPQLIRWLCEEPQAMGLVGPSGIAVLGARIVGDLNLDAVQPSFGISLFRSSISGRVSLAGAHLRWLTLNGSRTGLIFASGLTSDLRVELNGVDASAGLVLDDANINGDLWLMGSHFRQIPLASYGPVAALAAWKLAVRAVYSRVQGSVALCCGFEADGGVQLDNSIIGGDLMGAGGRFLNPNNVALEVDTDNIAGAVIFSWPFALPSQSAGMPTRAEFDGWANFPNCKVASFFFGDAAIFKGAKSESHGLAIISTSVGTFLSLKGIELRNGASLSLEGSSAQVLVDDRDSWPEAGRLRIDGFSYRQLASLNDADSRLHWLGLQEGFHPQPYRQLAKQLTESGDDAGATRVLIAKEDLRYREFGIAGRFWGEFLKWTIGYGHRPMLTIMWSALVVLLGWSLVWIGNRAGVMRRTYPENTPGSAADHYEELYPLLYSLDVFLPFVNLHQERYWWPDGRTAGEFAVLGGRVPIRGSILRCYLWLQIIAGWILSAIFVAGVTGLIRGD